MIILREECIPPPEEIESARNHYKKEKFIINESYYSSYFDLKDSDNYSNYSNKILIDFYDLKIKEAMKKFGLYHRSKYRWEMWIQIYDKNVGGHCEHDHFSGTGMISWVNFVQTPTQKCFYFLDSQNNKNYPDQDSGQLIFFPSWVSHGVDKTHSDGDRIVIAGNIHFEELFSDGHVFVSSANNTNTIWTWEFI